MIARGATFYGCPMIPEWCNISNKHVQSLWNAECGPYYQEKMAWRTKHTSVITALKAYIYLSQEFPNVHSLLPSHMKETEATLRSFEQSVVSFQMISEPVYTT